MNNISELKAQLRKKIEEKKQAKKTELADGFVEQKQQIGEAVLGPILLNMKPLEQANKETVKRIDKQTGVLESNAKVLASLVEATKAMAKKTIDLNETKAKEHEEDKKEREKHTNLLLAELKNVVKRLEAQGKFEKPDPINLADVEELLRQLNDKEYPEVPQTDLSTIEGQLKKLVGRKVSLDEVEGLLKDIYEVLLKAWLPSENALQVIVKNQVQPASGGVIPFKDANNNTVKPLVGTDGYLVTSQNNILVSEKHDYISAGYPDTTTEVFTYKLGGASGTTVATVTVVYTDDSKSYVSTVTKT